MVILEVVKMMFLFFFIFHFRPVEQSPLASFSLPFCPAAEDSKNGAKKTGIPLQLGQGTCSEEGTKFNGSVLYLKAPQEIQVQTEQLIRIPDKGLVVNARLKDLSGEQRDVSYF